jgi:DNA-binding transcriptional LysR family regulator
MDNSRHITAQHLRYLVALVAECHVTRAANRMGIGQPAMSTALSRLRVLFNDPLLIKTTHGMEATPRARDLARRAEDAIELLSGAQRDADQFDPATTREHFHISATEGITSLLVPPLMERIRAEAPGIRISISVRDISRASEYLQNGEIDLILAFIRNPAPDLHQTLLYSHRLYCIASKHHTSIQGRISLDQFSEGTHVVWGMPPSFFPTLELMVDDALRKLNRERQVALHLSTMRSAAAVVATTDLLAVMTEHTARQAASSLDLQILELPFEVDVVDVSMLWHQRWHHVQSHAWLRARLREVAAKLDTFRQVP